MKPEIEAYLRDHGARYTTDALRSRLVAAGHDPTEIEAALAETEAARMPLLSDRQTFGRVALWFHLAAPVVMIVLVIILNGAQALGLALIAAVVLALFLALGWAVSSLIGRALLPRTGLMVALIFPLISALALGGWCLAIMGSVPGVAN